MIVVKVEIWPGGDERKAREHTRAYISNTGKRSAETNGEFGEYEATFMQNELFNPKKVWKKSAVGPTHRRKRGAWDIIFKALRNAGLDERNPT